MRKENFCFAALPVTGAGDSWGVFPLGISGYFDQGV